MGIPSLIVSFPEIEAEFIERVHRVVWCNMGTTDTKGRVRSRIVHPIWEGPTGWVVTRRYSPKAKHLAQNPYVSLAYMWVDEPAAKQHVWDIFIAAPPPLGYDPASIFQAVDHPDSGVLKFTPWRIEVDTLPVERKIWQGG
jgi:hypothetical protein